MGESLLILLREGFEASLIVAILFAYLRRIGRLSYGRAVWLGVGVAAVLAIVVGVVIHLTVGTLEGANRLRSFAAISIVAAVVLTWMVFWMRRQSRAIKGDLEHKIDAALLSGNVARGLAVVAFFAVLREGIETALFLIAAMTTPGTSTGSVIAGGLIGLVLSMVLGYLVYAGGRRLPMRSFFRVTGMVVIVFAAGLCAKAVFFLQSSGDLGTVNNAFFNLTGYAVLTLRSQVGRFLSGLFGWDPRPSIEQVLAWALYIVPTAYFFLRDHRPPAPDVDAATLKQSSARAA